VDRIAANHWWRKFAQSLASGLGITLAASLAIYGAVRERGWVIWRLCRIAAWSNAVAGAITLSIALMKYSLALILVSTWWPHNPDWPPRSLFVPTPTVVPSMVLPLLAGADTVRLSQ
jgi:hypothetical protein